MELYHGYVFGDCRTGGRRFEQSGHKQPGKQANIIVVGEVEAETKSVNIRNRDDEVQGREETVTVADAVQKLVALKKSRASDNKL